MPNYIVVLRASSAAKFHPEQPSLKAQAFPTPVGPVDMTFQTRYADEGFNVTIPRELWVDARGPAPSLDDAIKAFWNAAQMPVAVIALTTNAAIEDLDLHLAYDNTPGRSEREFFQNFLPEERGIPRQGRRVPVDATVSLLRAIDTHPERDRLLRAIAYYYNALSHWKPG
jgi:hypothetical protein